MILDLNEKQISNNQVIRLDYYDKYNFNDDAGYVHYTLCDYRIILGFDEITGEPVPDGQGGQAYTILKQPVADGDIPLTLELINQWGADDQIIFDYVATELGLTFN